MKVLFLNRFFHPNISPASQILSDLAFHLAGEHPVHVITSCLKYGDAGVDLPPREVVRGGGRASGVDLALRTRLSGGSHGRCRLLYIRHAPIAFLGNDIVVPMTDPPLISVPASVAARVKGAKVVNWLQDIVRSVAGELDCGSKWTTTCRS